ncbi:DVU0772 family protein [Oleidesulfovibrio sp.]|uniref:DVU0772 family protein n=1 Tax=Oleidesulfovibrio sp. TaxID=2909707 RepID=UPI003A8A0043
MSELARFGNLDIDWNLSPEHAVTMYLEWGNNDWHAEYPPVRSKDDISTYFVVDTWGPKPVVRLVRRNSEKAEELVTVDLPEHLANRWLHEHGDLKGICEPTEEIKAWLRKELGHE